MGWGGTNALQYNFSKLYGLAFDELFVTVVVIVILINKIKHNP